MLIPRRFLLTYLILTLTLILTPLLNNFSFADEEAFGATDLPSSFDHLASQNEQAMDLSCFPSSIVDGCVNVITGDYFEHAADVVMPGTAGIKIERSYSSRGCKRGTLQYGWDINHGGKVIRQHSTNHRYAYVKGTERNGTLYQLNREDENETIYHVHDSFIEKGLTNVFGGEISANTHLKNDCLRRTPSAWATLETANKTVHLFTDAAHDADKKKNIDSVSRLTYSRFPSGIQYFYSYYDDKDLDFVKEIQISTRSQVIEEEEPQEPPKKGTKDYYKNKKKQYKSEIIAKLSGEYKTVPKRSKLPLRLTYSDEEKHYGTAYEFSNDSRPILKTVNSFQEPPVTYHYHSPEKNWERLHMRELPDGRYKYIEYYPKIKAITYTTNPYRGHRVKSLFAPAGRQGESVAMYQFDYEKDKDDCFATVIDALNVKTIYRWKHDEKRIRSVEHFDEKGLLSLKEKTYWYDAKKPFIKGVVWEDGQGQLLIGRRFKYSSSYNVKAETLYGNLTGRAIPSSQDEYIIHSEYDDRQRIISKTEGALTTTYTYDEKTDLIASEFTSYDGKVQIRKFYEHDASAALTLEIIDDGSNEGQEDYRNVSERHIKRIKNNLLGQPLEACEYALDLTTKEEILLKKTVNTYGADHRLTRQVIYGADGNYSHELSWEYDPRGNVLSETNPSGFKTVKTYDDNDNLASETGPGIAPRKYTYDKMNRLTAEEHLAEPYYKKIHTYDYLGHKTSSTDIYGNTTFYSYNHLGHLAETLYPQVLNDCEYPFCPKIVQTCDPLGRVISLKDPRGYTISSTYNARGKPIRIDYPDGSHEQFYYTLGGQLEHSIGRDKTEIKYTYDAQDRELKKEWFDPQESSLKSIEKTYNALHLISETDSRGTTTAYTYDSAGRIASKATGNRKTTYAYDHLGREAMVKEELEDGSWIAHTKAYDVQDRVIFESSIDSFGNTADQTTYSYNEAGKCTFKNIENSIYLTEYDPYLRVIKEIDPLEQQTLYSYTTKLNGQGIPVLVKEITDCRGIKTVITHDALGRVAHQETIDSFGTTFEEISTLYDPIGNKAKQSLTTKGAPVVNRFIYNAMGRLIKTTEALGTPEQKTVSRKYDHADRLTALTKADGIVLGYTYDHLGRMAALTSSDAALAISYTYDENSNILSAHDHELEITRSYNIHNQLISEIFPYGDLKYSYDASGRLIRFTLPDHSSVATTYRGMKPHTIERQGPLTYDETYLDYDNSLNPTKIQLPKQSGLLEYTYDLLNRPLTTKTPFWTEHLLFSNNLVDQKNLQDSQGSQECRFSYDPLKRLLNEDGIAEHSFTYDMLGNAITFDGNPRTFNARNALQSDSKGTYTYDLNGNRIEGGKTTYSYDPLDRLIAVQTETGTYTYRYDPTGRRLFKQHGDEKIAYLWQQEEEIGSLSLNSPDILLDFRALDPQGRPFALELQGKLYLPIQDAYGHVRALFDPETNDTCATYRYSAFGEEQTFGSLLSPWRFAGKRADPETGLIYFGKRYYDPQSLSWTTPDPLDDADGFNLYAYVHNNPLLYVDPDGCLTFMFEFFTNPNTIMKSIAIAAVAAPIIGWAVIGFAEGFITGFADGITSTAIDLALDGATLYSEGTAAYAEMEMTSKAYHFYRTVGKVGGALAGSFTPPGRIMQTLTAGANAIKATKLVAGGAKFAQTVSKTSTNVQKIGSGIKKGEALAKVGARNRFRPNTLAEGAHSVFRKDPLTNKITKYETFIPQTNPRNPCPWESLKRFDGEIGIEGRHYNKVLREYVNTPHVHDVHAPGGVRYPEPWEIPK
jgi:RHS repeat-associated protein